MVKLCDSRFLPVPSSQESDYGGDFTLEEEQVLSSLLTQYNSQAPSNAYRDGVAGVRSSPRSFASVNTLEELVQSGAFPAEVEITVAKDASSSQTAGAVKADLSPASPAPSARQSPGPTSESQQLPSTEETRPPLARFRAHRPLSVTDLVSPAWCEQQYSFSLHHHGRKRRTAAMKQGSKAHQKLEDEVHATFSVEVLSKEDAWGLRFWNVIQGARTLRETGMTRELEVWGLVNGELVNGVIDELCYECPDFDLEMEAVMSEEATKGSLEAGQQSIEDFYKAKKPAGSGTGLVASNRFKDSSNSDLPKVYLKDHKTRTVRSVPKGSAFKPTAMQLMIYHRLLANLASEQNTLDPAVLWQRYGVNPDTRFSDSFISQFGETPSSTAAPHDDQQSLADTHVTTSTPSQPSDQSIHSFHTQATEPSALTVSFDDLNSILRAHPTPRELWSRMVAELSRAIPAGLGSVLRVEYWDQSESDQLGSRNFLFDAKTLDAYSARTMSWWKGEREPVGVEVEDAWKCRICEFAEICAWRQSKVEDHVQRFRAKGKKG